MRSSNSEPRTTREALIAQMLGELDDVLTRSEQLSTTIAETEVRIARTVQALDYAGEKYRQAVAAFTEDAKARLTEHTQRHVTEVTIAAAEKQAAVRQDGGAQDASSKVASQPGVSACQASRASRLLEHGLTAILASVLTATMVLAIVRLG